MLSRTLDAATLAWASIEDLEASVKRKVSEWAVDGNFCSVICFYGVTRLDGVNETVCDDLEIECFIRF